MKRTFLITGVLILIGCSTVWPQDTVRIYQAELVRKIPMGRGPGELGYWAGPGIANIPSFPLLFGGKIFIMDTDNGRLNVYDREFRFIKEMRFDASKTDIAHSYHFSILADGGVIGISSIEAVRLNNDGTVAYRIPVEKLPEHVWNNGQYWLFKDYLLFTERSDGGDYRVIDGKGQFLTSTQITRLNEAMKADSSLWKESPRLRDAIDKFLQDSKLMLLGDKNVLLTSNIELYNRFYQVIRENSDQVIKNQVRDAEYSLEKAAVGSFDAEGNRHWYLTNLKTKKRLRYIISSHGEVLDYFSITPENLPYGYAEDGNLYAIVRNSRDKTYNLYRVQRHW